jgi:alpha-mannosidase
VKPAESDFVGTVIVRLYESHGGRHQGAALRFDRRVRNVAAVDLLEEKADARVEADGGVVLGGDGKTVSFNMAAFQVISLRVQFESVNEVAL